MSKRTWKMVTEEEFNQIKQLLSLGFKGRQLEQISERTSATLSFIRHSENYADYKKKSNEHWGIFGKRNKKVPSDKSAETVTFIADSSNGVVPSISLLHNDLQELTKAVYGLVEAWKEKPKGIFH